MAFLNIDVGARAVGMGGTFTCVDNDVSALFWNPAGISKIKGGVVKLNHTQWIADMKQYALAAAYGTKNIGTFGFTFIMMDNGSIERTIPDPLQSRGFSVEGTYNVGQWVAGLAYGRQITNKFSIGGQVKYAFQDLGDVVVAETAEDSVGHKVNNQKGTLAFDFGTLYYFGFKDLRIGMSIRNFSRPVKYSYESFNLPITFKVGLAMNMLSLIPAMTDHQIQIGIETVHPYDHKEKIQIGGEYQFKNLLAIRLGYRSNTDTGALSTGFGLTPAAFGGINLMVDYAYSDADDAFGAIHRFSFGFTF
ncbi:MAG: PorV/PorQ family protein [bacterium]|nr:MAG: PorV/PorQ family protein [bacterium]